MAKFSYTFMSSSSAVMKNLFMYIYVPKMNMRQIYFVISQKYKLNANSSKNAFFMLKLLMLTMKIMQFKYKIFHNIYYHLYELLHDLQE